VRTKTGTMMTGFNPAISRDALTKIGAQVRSWPNGGCRARLCKARCW
jgi:hypothetical protein